MCVFSDDDDDDCSLSPSTAPLSSDALWKRVAGEAALGHTMMKNGGVRAGGSVFSQRISEAEAGESLPRLSFKGTESRGSIPLCLHSKYEAIPPAAG